MTYKEFYTTIVNEGTLNEEAIAFAKAEMEKIETKEAKTAELIAAKEAERKPVREALIAALTGDFQTRDQLIAAAGLDIKPESVPALLKSAIAEGTVVKGEVKVDKRARVGYARP